jgi:hypothetical protein
MTLRMRLVVALVGLLAVGLAAFGFVTNRLYANSEYERLDEQLDDAVAPVTVELDVQAGLSVDDAAGDEAPPPEGPGGPLGELSLYAALIDADGAILAERHPETDVRPALPDLTEQIRLRPARPELFLTVGSVGGTTRWRVLVTVPREFSRARDHVVVLAAPTTTVEESLERLVVVEAVAGAGLLAALAVGSWSASPCSAMTSPGWPGTWSRTPATATTSTTTWHRRPRSWSWARPPRASWPTCARPPAQPRCWWWTGAPRPTPTASSPASTLARQGS